MEAKPKGDDLREKLMELARFAHRLLTVEEHFMLAVGKVGDPNIQVIGCCKASERHFVESLAVGIKTGPDEDISAEIKGN